MPGVYFPDGWVVKHWVHELRRRATLKDQRPDATIALLEMAVQVEKRFGVK